jgi:hypothetical protein
MKITLCGSTKFKQEFELTNRLLTKRGHLVYSVSWYSHSGDEVSKDLHERLDLIHLMKIKDSDAICLVGHDHSKDHGIYVGNGLKREMLWAILNDKKVLYLPISHGESIEKIEKSNLTDYPGHYHYE